jgi:signal transduction histidine kinase/DNA-binding response OmpR family regulator
MTNVGVIQPLRERGGNAHRMRLRHAAFWSVLLWGSHSPATAQAPDSAASDPFVHESWTVQDGLPVNAINALLQSRDGYIWIATFDGLVRFDGVRFTVFNSGNSPGLPSNRVVTVREARNGDLWLRTELLQLVRYRNGRFTHIGPESGLQSRVRTLHEDANGTLWVGTDRGLGVIRDERFVAVAPDVIRDPIHSLASAEDGSIFAGSVSGALFQTNGERATTLLAPEQLRSQLVNKLHIDPDGWVWIGTNGGIWRYRDALESIASSRQVLGFSTSPVTGETWILTQSATLRHNGARIDTVLNRRADPFMAERLIPDAAGRMLHTSGAELHREGSHIHTLPAPLRGAPRSQLENITSVVLDHEGSLWLGTVGAGLHRLKPSPFTVISEPEGLSSRNVYAILEDRAGDYWVGSLLGGINRISRSGVERLPVSHQHPIETLSLHQDREGRLWIGGGSGLGPRVCTLPAMQCVQPRPELTSGLTVRAIHQDARGAVWFGTDSRLLRVLDGVWTSFTAGDGAPTVPVRVFQETEDGALWMGTNGGGLARYHEGRFTHITQADGLPIDLVRSLHVDGDGWLWIGTEGRGLARLDPREWAGGGTGGRIVSFRTSDGLFDEVIHQILEDDFGRLWMSSNRGIFRVDRRELLDFADGRIARINSTGYTERDGLRNREANGGSQPAGIRASDGRMWFATQDGVAIVDPARVEQNAIPPRVVVERVIAGETAVRITDALLELGVEQRDLEIEYTALSFLAPANVRFRYRLDPYDPDWVEAGSRRTAFYTQVPPGRYTFRVLASNNDGVWNEQGAELAMQLQPRFHETNVFRVLVLLAIVILIGAGFRWRIRNLHGRARELGTLVNERTRELRQHQQQLAEQNARLEIQTGQLQELGHAKSRFFANVSHEFRTPLTLILGPLRDMAEGRSGALPDAVRRNIDMMTRNAQRLLRLVNQVLDLARLESGALTLDEAARDLVELARSVTRSFAPLAERRRIALAFHPDAETLFVRIDTEQMEKVLLNLLSNAFKFTEPGGRVTVTLREESGSAVLEVRDTGIGIAPEQLPHIFERFYQADSSATRRHEGTGIGLSLVHELIELHGGEITASSRPGEGSLFMVRLRLLSDAESALDRVEDEPAAPAGEGQPAEDRPGPDVEEESGAADATDRTTVLIVDDHADVRAYVRSVLEPAFRVIEGSDGVEGLDIAQRELPDLIISDVMMPRLDGYGLTRALRVDSATDCIPTILLTARAATDDEVHGLEAGADDYIAKPFHAAILEARVNALIAMRRRLRERFRDEGIPPPLADTTPVAPRSDLEERLRALIEENLTETDFNPDALAAAAGLSYKQLYRRLASELDSTPSRFIRTVRVERAADLLKDGAGNITEIAYSVGFNSLSYFHRCFQERFGLAPSAVTQTPR